MVEAVIEDRVCGACGAEVRPDTQYCYNCGGPVMDETSRDADEAALETDNAGERNGSSATSTDQLSKPETAASLRKRSRAFQRKPVRIAWEPADDTPNPVFIISVFVLLAFAIISILLALYFN